MNPSNRNLRDDVLETLTAAGFPLDYETLATRIGANQPSIRVATRKLQQAGLVRIFNYGDGTTYDRRTWVPVTRTGDVIPATN